MTEAIITAAAWSPSEPTAGDTKEGETTGFLWQILAEASVMASDGTPVADLTKSAWKVLVTDASSVTFAPSFTVVPIVPVFAPAPVPGFYLVTVSEFPTKPWVEPTAFGIAISSRKLSLAGQVVVPIALAGPTVVSTLTTPVI